MKDKNWRITRWGAASVALLSVLYVFYAVSGISLVTPLVVSSVAGLVLAASIKSGNLERFRPAVRPVSGVLTLFSGALLLYSLNIFVQAALRSTLSSVADVASLDQLLILIQGKLVTFAGYGLATGALFITFTGVGVVLWDRLDQEKPVGARGHDLYFTGILTGITLFSAFGTALLNQVPIGKVSQAAYTAYLSPGAASGVISGFMLLLTYFMSRRAWMALPLREMVPRELVEEYDRLKKPEKVFRWMLLPLTALGVAAQPFLDLRYLQLLSPLSSGGFRFLMLGLTAVSMTALLSVKLLKTVTGDRELLARLTPYLIYGGLVYLASFYLAGLLPEVIAAFPGFVSALLNQVKDAIGASSLVMAFMTASALFAFATKILLSGLKGTGLVPEGIEGTMLASAGVFFTAIGLQLYIPSPNLLFMGVAASLITWEIGKRSTVLGREVGRKGSSMKSELVQLASKIAVLVAAVIGARTLHLYIESTNLGVAGSYRLTVLLTSLIGLGLLAYSLKEFT